MSEFQVFYQLGLDHILDRNGYDHILFIIALCTLYQIEDLRNVLILVTSFTIGHSVTLVLATMKWIMVNAELIEFLIPLTILITAISNLLTNQTAQTKRNFFFAGFFGLIHGMGFSNYLQALLGRNNEIVTQLLAFNIGLEVGQIIIVAIFLALGFLITVILNVSARDWKIAWSSAIVAVACLLITDSDYYQQIIIQWWN